MKNMRLEAFKYFGILGICLLHSSFILSGGGRLYTAVTSISGIVLPSYFFLSGYFFTLSYSNNIIERKIISRFKKIVIPYIMWQIIFIYLTKILLKLTNSGLGYTFTDSTYAPSGIKEILRFIWLGYCDPPLWYLVVLFELIIITPSLINVMSGHRYFFAFIIVIIFTVNIMYYGNIAYASIFYWSPVYLSGIYIAIFDKGLILKEEIKLSKKICSLLVFCIFCICLYFLSIRNVFFVNYFKYIGWMISPVFMLGISYIIPCRELYTEQFDSEFIIFCTHYPVLHIVSSLFGNLNYEWAKNKYIIWILVLLITLIFCHILHFILKTHCRIIYKFIYGKY